MFLLVLRQTMVMAVYMLLGYYLFVNEKITLSTTKQLAHILIYTVLPCVVIRSFRMPYSLSNLKLIGISFLCGLLTMIVAFIVGITVYRRKPIEFMAASFFNSGFFGLPLITMIMGQEAVIYIISLVFFVGALQHSVGVYAITGEKQGGVFKHFITAPNTIGTISGMVIFLLGWGTKLPVTVNQILDGIANLNAPIAMIVLGSYLAESDLKKVFTTPSLYGLSFIRLLLIPILTAIVLSFINIDSNIKIAILIASSTPAGTNTAIYCQLYDKDYPYACQAVSLTTIFCIFTLPLIATIGNMMFK